MSAFVVPTQFTAIDKFSAPMRAMSGAMNGFIGKAERMAFRANTAFNSMLSPLMSLRNMLNGVGVYIGFYTLIRLARNAIDVFADFQQAQIDIRAVTNNNVGISSMLANQARELALRYGESATSILATDLALLKMGKSATQTSQAIEAILTGSVALKAVPEELAKAVGASMTAFKMPEGSEQKIVDMFAKAADISALDWEELRTMLPIAQGAASITGYTLPEMLGLFAAARNAQVHVASGSTAIKNMMVKSGLYDKDLSKLLEKITASSNSIKTAFKLFGPKTLVTALPLAEAMKIGDLEKLIDTIENASKGYAEFVANIRLGTFRGAAKILSRSWEEFILSIEDGNGPLSKSLTDIVKVSSAMFLLSSNSEFARKAIKEFNPEIVAQAEKWLGWLKVTGYVIVGLIALKALLIAWRAIVILATIAQGAWSVAMGVAAAAGWVNVMSLRGNIIALTSLRIVTALATGAQVAFNAVLKANPIVLITTSILALITAYEMLEMKLKSSQEEMAKLAVEKNLPFQAVENSFLDKLKHMFIPGSSLEIGTLRPGDSDSTQQTVTPKVNPKPFSNEAIDSLLKIVNKGRLDVNINDPGNNVQSVKSDSSYIQPKVTRTQDWD